MRALLAVAAASLLCGCATDVTGAEAHRLVEQGARLLDVRSREEFAEVHIDGSQNIPVEELKARLGELPRDRPIIVYCHSGARASAAVVILGKAGFRKVHNMGTYYRWSEARRPPTPSLF